LAVWTWAATTATVVAGVIVIALTPALNINGVGLLIGPLLISAGVTAGGIIAGLRNAWGILFLVVAIEVVFIVLKFLNPWGIGTVL
jgi:hypothetical protein